MTYSPELVAAVRYELVLREDKLPKRVASGKMTAEAAQVDYQAWHCILGFIETGQFRSIDGGGADGDTIVSWPEAVAAADKAAAAVLQQAQKAVGDKAPALWQRHAFLVAIQREVALRAGSIAWINQQLQATAAAKAAA
jgi:hypothetical protein